ncbi:hypothetical protein [Pelotalea chapellei]|uniref:Uncharacterized protein n=1 Tax=Pelotalea chapellei TaxID=44671 RepID=A0ABS5U7H2_9BACT|nr:hypothetical protein [Pelotalea chapellei]MBT1071622.1 hypothetical protein [Pelotalea chapellei]
MRRGLAKICILFIFVFLPVLAFASPVPLYGGYVPATAFDPVQLSTTASTSYIALNRTQNSLLSLANNLSYAQFYLETINTNISSIYLDTYNTRRTVDAIPPRFNNISSKLSTIERKLNNISGTEDGMDYKTAVLVGLCLAVIFAITWRG